jgi:hypothetical protein
MIDAAKTVKRHWDGILRWHGTHIANGILKASTVSSRPPRPRLADTARRTT